MKISDWRRKLAASLVAGGLMAPGAVFAQNLNTNLVVNPSFENVGPVCPTSPFCYSASEILNWTAGTVTGFAYNFGQGYDVGGPLAGGGSYYFTPNTIGSAVDDIVTMPGQVSQDIDVSGGPAGTQIASGEAAVRLSAYFDSYTTDNDIGNLHVEFRNAAGVSLGSTKISAQAPITTWQQRSGAAFIPVGTTTIRASVYGTSTSFGPDGYVDLVDVQVTQAQNELMYLEVNTTNGQMKIKNQSGKTFHIDEYTINAAGSTNGDYNNNGTVDAADYALWRNGGPLQNDSTPGVQAADYDVWKANFGKSAGALNPASWTSLQDQNLAGFPAGNGTGNGWEEDGGSRASVIGESFLTGNSAVTSGTTLNLGAAFNVGSPQNLEFRYSVVPDNGSGQFVGPGSLVRGFVRYVTVGSAAAVPEPTSVIFAGIGLATALLGGRTTTRIRKL